MEPKDLTPNQTVGLAQDAAFRGYYYGTTTAPDLTLGEIAIVYVSEPGASGRKQGVVTMFPVRELVAVKRVMR